MGQRGSQACYPERPRKDHPPSPARRENPRSGTLVLLGMQPPLLGKEGLRTTQFLEARSTTKNGEAGDSPPCITARRGGRDIKKDVAKPPFLERTGWFSDPNKRKTTLKAARYRACAPRPTASLRWLRDIL